MAIGEKKVIKISDRQRHGINNIDFDGRMRIIAVIVAIIIGVLLAFMPNAYKITIDGVEVGAVKDKKIVDKAKETVITQLKGIYNSEVKFEEEPVVTRYRARKKDYIDSLYLISYMRKHSNVLISFKEIYVDGQAIGTVAKDEDVEALKEGLKEKYYGDKEVEVEFAKKVEVKDQFAKESDLIGLDKLINKCMVTTPKVVEYTVQPGDTLSGIATTLGTSIDNIVNANEGFNAQTVLQLNQTIKANVNEPLLPLKIVKKVSSDAGEHKVADTEDGNTEE